jgi:hypothetical protein
LGNMSNLGTYGPTRFFSVEKRTPAAPSWKRCEKTRAVSIRFAVVIRMISRRRHAPDAQRGCYDHRARRCPQPDGSRRAGPTSSSRSSSPFASLSSTALLHA